MKRVFIIVGFFMMLLAPVTVPVLAYDPLHGACQNASADAQSGSVCQDAANQAGNPNNDPIVTTIAKAAKIISIIVGIASVILVVASGLTLILSGGNPEAVKSSKSRLVAAVVGLVIASLAWTIASFVINRLL